MRFELWGLFSHAAVFVRAAINSDEVWRQTLLLGYVLIITKKARHIRVIMHISKIRLTNTFPLKQALIEVAAFTKSDIFGSSMTHTFTLF